MATSLYLMHEGLVLAILLVAVEGATLLGQWLGRRRSNAEPNEARSQLGTVVGGALGLLALFLAFTFDMASERFSQRKSLVVAEANALGTLDLRARIMPEPQQTRIRALIREYVRQDVEFYEAGVAEEDLARVGAQMSLRLEALWAEAVVLATSEPRSVPVGLFVEALNDVIDLREERVAALENRVPEAVIQALMLIAVLSMGMLGFAAGVGPRRDLIPVHVAGIMIVLVVLLIVDFGRPRRGLLRSGQGSILRVERSLGDGQ